MCVPKDGERPIKPWTSQQGKLLFSITNICRHDKEPKTWKINVSKLPNKNPKPSIKWGGATEQKQGGNKDQRWHLKSLMTQEVPNSGYNSQLCFLSSFASYGNKNCQTVEWKHEIIIEILYLWTFLTTQSLWVTWQCSLNGSGARNLTCWTSIS